MYESYLSKVLGTLSDAFGSLIGGDQSFLFVLFLMICVIQFVLVFILYRENQKSHYKIHDLEKLLEVTADRALSIRERTDSVTYQEIVSRLKAGEKPSEISKTVSVSLKELEALKRIVKTVS